MPTQQFLHDRARGREAQNYVAEIIRSWGYEVENIADGYFAEYDLVVRKNGLQTTVEVKSDFMAAKTGNLCLELEALDHSKADLLAIVVKPPTTIYFKELPEVRQFAHDWGKFVQVGEFHQRAALIPRSIFLDRMKPEIITTQP